MLQHFGAQFSKPKSRRGHRTLQHSLFLPMLGRIERTEGGNSEAFCCLKFLNDGISVPE